MTCEMPEGYVYWVYGILSFGKVATVYIKKVCEIFFIRYSNESFEVNSHTFYSSSIPWRHQNDL
jgi:hypothetical protein